MTSEAIKESASTGATNTNEEVPTTSSVEADKPAALGESAATTVASVVEVKTDESAQSVAAADDSLATKEETVITEDTVKPSVENDETVKVITELADQVKVSDVGTQEEVKAVTEAAVERSRTGSLATEKEKVSSTTL